MVIGAVLAGRAIVKACHTARGERGTLEDAVASEVMTAWSLR